MSGSKIVIVGAGSRQFGRDMVADLLGTKELQGRGMSICLTDIDEEALDVMHRFAKLLKDHHGSDMALSATTDRREALPDADYVLTAVSVRRWDLWEQDFRIPLAYGFRHVLGENGGPGALFHAMRSLNILIPVCRDIEELCPDTLLLNFTNPEGRVLDAILHLTKVKAAGLCHGVFNAIRAISEISGVPIKQLEVTSAGLNHFYYVMEAVNKETGEDVLPAVKEKVANDDSMPTTLWKKLIEIYGWLTYRSDNHIGEYLAYGPEFHGIKWRYGMESRKVTARRPGPHGDWLLAYLDGKPLDNRALRRSGEIAIPVITDMELDRTTRHDAVNVLNDGYIENLPSTAVVEVPATCDGKGLHPIAVGAIPEPPAAFMRTQLAIQRLVTEAYATNSKKLLLQALLLDPVVNSVTAAEKMLDEMLELQADFLPAFE